jgi:uncharacterized protein YcgI (DUF1989 family)
LHVIRSDRVDEAHGPFCPKPFERGFYERVRSSLSGAPFREVARLVALDGALIEAVRGSMVRIELLECAQIVNMFAFNRDDPDERLWHQSLVSEGLFLKVFSRLWGTMARYRPLLTVIEESVQSRLGDVGLARHHPLLGGSGTPADWRYAGGPEGVRTTWEQFASLMAGRSLSPHLITQNVSLFQKSYVDGNSQRLEVVPSDAARGDRVTFFVEVDLCILVVLSPYVDGSRPATERDGTDVQAVSVAVAESSFEPLGWPYPGVPYPDLALYLGSDGSRSSAPEQIQLPA